MMYKMVRGLLDNGSTRNQSILDHCDNAALDEVSIRLPRCFLHVVCVDDLNERREENMLKE